MEKLTAIIPVYNEAHNIEAALQSISFADEIIVVDSLSTDDTVKLATPLAHKIISRKFDYPSAQKNWAIPQATHEWVLLIDADERITKELEKEIKNILNNPPKDIGGYWLYRKNHFMGKHIRYSGWQNDKVIRLFRKSVCKYQNKYVHEEIESQLPIEYLENKLYHNTYTSIHAYVSKLNRYAYWQARDYDKKTNKITVYHLAIKPFWRFFKHYFIQQGFRDGIPGFTICFLQAYASLMRYINLWLYRRGIS